MNITRLIRCDNSIYTSIILYILHEFDILTKFGNFLGTGIHVGFINIYYNYVLLASCPKEYGECLLFDLLKIGFFLPS